MRVLVSLAQLAGQPAALLVGRQLDKLAAENMVFQVDALGRALGLHVEIFGRFAGVAGLCLAVPRDNGPELVEVGHVLVEHVGQDALFQFVVRALEIIALVAGNDRAFIGEIVPVVIFRTGKPVFGVDVLLKGFKEFGLLIDLTERV
ncbi:hypothetical protein XPR_4290 [Xanthomonas arboricola pv. pruni MAFF 301420]|uniref:Uncharacterized protein n=1 Tax=Xanthomonas arboricola pv. pruni MAFF 301420 TaxID=1418095 RepID=W4SM50_9XANT|nr:hypothetical protein XPR_4290 [Xanthomonas arboricola pv. pruni MAFF 301420]